HTRFSRDWSSDVCSSDLKPLAVTLEQGVEMVEVGKKAGRILSVGFQPRYDPNMQTVKNIVQSGELGNVYYVQTGGGRRRGMPGRSEERRVGIESISRVVQ